MYPTFNVYVCISSFSLFVHIHDVQRKKENLYLCFLLQQKGGGVLKKTVEGKYSHLKGKVSVYAHVYISHKCSTVHR